MAFLIGLIVGALIMIYSAPHYLTPATRGETLFVYGTLKSELVRFTVCRCLVPETSATLLGYRKVGRTIVPEADASVDGAFIVVTPDALTRIDRYEGTPHHYERVRMAIEGRAAWVYIERH